jgi:hypothetical protein
LASGSVTVVSPTTPQPGPASGKNPVVSTKKTWISATSYRLDYTYKDGTHSSHTYSYNTKPGTGGANPVYRNYLTRLGIKSSGVTTSLIKTAQANHWDLALFDRELRMKATKAYMNSYGGRKDQADFLAAWQTYFPGQKASKANYLSFIKKGMNASQVKQYIMGSKPFQQQYVAKGFNTSLAELRNNPQEFLNWSQTFANVMKGYGLQVGNPQYKLFFGGQQTPEQFTQNAQTVFGGTQFYNNWQGQPLEQNQSNAALYGGLGGENYRARIANAYNATTSFMKDKANPFNTNMTPTGQVQQANGF